MRARASTGMFNSGITMISGGAAPVSSDPAFLFATSQKPPQIVPYRTWLDETGSYIDAARIAACFDSDQDGKSMEECKCRMLMLRCNPTARANRFALRPRITRPG